MNERGCMPMIGHATSKLIVSWLRTTLASRDGRAVLQCGLMARSLAIKRVLVACCPTQAGNPSRLWVRLIGKYLSLASHERKMARMHNSLVKKLDRNRLALN